jgi:cytochrome c6
MHSVTALSRWKCGIVQLVFGSIWLSYSPVSAQEISGKTLFLKNCSACHQADGQGIPDAFPALAGNSFVMGSAKDVASLLLTGRSGMPNFSKRLNDQDITAIVNYVRNAWGNRGADIAPEQIATLRA